MDVNTPQDIAESVPNQVGQPPVVQTAPEASFGDPNLAASKVLQQVGLGKVLNDNLGKLSRDKQPDLPAPIQALKDAYDKFTGLDEADKMQKSIDYTAEQAKNLSGAAKHVSNDESAPQNLKDFLTPLFTPENIDMAKQKANEIFGVSHPNSQTADYSRNAIDQVINHYAAQSGQGVLNNKIDSLADQNKEDTKLAQALQAQRNQINSPAVFAPVAAAADTTNDVDKLSAIDRMTKSSDKEMSSSVKDIFNSDTKAPKAPTDYSNYDANVKRLKEFAQDPQGMIDHLYNTTNAMYGTAPNISMGIQSQMINGINYLNSKVPKPMMQYPASEEFDPSETQKDKFNGVFNTLNAPHSVLHAVKDGSLSNDQMDAMQAVFPHLVQDMQSKVIQQMTPDKMKNMPYATKIAIAKFLGTPLDSLMSPQSLASSQMALQGPQQSTQVPTQKPKKTSTLGGLSKLSLGSRSATNTQNLEQNDD